MSRPWAVWIVRLHDEICPILECYVVRVEDPSRRQPDARATRASFFTGVSARFTGSARR
jgi:hypothetical protein